ncbi:MAG: M3 family oligoendopeptidase [Fimbriimonadaceae bacterium]
MSNAASLTPEALTSRTWADYEPRVQQLLEADLTADSAEGWLTDLSEMQKEFQEQLSRLNVATTVDTTDDVARNRWTDFLENTYEKAADAQDKLNRKWLESGIRHPGFEVPQRQMEADASIFREENIPIKTVIEKISLEYDELAGSQSVTWEGEERTLSQMRLPLLDDNRDRREAAWRTTMDAWQQNRSEFNDLWKRFLAERMKLANNAGFGNDFRAYSWKGMHRFDYTPEDCATFRKAIRQHVVPAAAKIYERRKKKLGVDSLRPWDLDVDPLGREPLKPFQNAEELSNKSANIFRALNPKTGEYYEIMERENLLDLDNRKGKAPGGYCTSFAVAGRPFIFMNAVGLHDDVQTLLHEAGHSFHVFEAAELPSFFQEYGAEIAEVASMSMELLAGRFLEADKGGFYSAEDAERARQEHLENLILFWPYMAVVDGFQHWVYENPELASDPANCDAKWAELWDQFMVGVDYEGLEEQRKTGWHRKLHIFQAPFYYVEYGLAQLGAVQIWRNSVSDPEKALTQYLYMLSLGSTKPFPELFAAGGARFGFDNKLVSEAVGFITSNMAD